MKSQIVQAAEVGVKVMVMVMVSVLIQEMVKFEQYF
jgi:hypothetical protein